MNLEDFFIAEYEKLKDENESLKAQVAELSKPNGAAGLLDARVVSTEVEAVKTTTASSYTLREYTFKGKPSSYIEENNAENWRLDGYEKPFAVSRKTFAMLIEVKTIGKVCRFLVDNNCKLEELGDMEQGEWCLAEQEAELVEDAKKELLNEMDDAIKRLKDKEAKETAE